MDLINGYNNFSQKVLVEIMTIHTDKDFYVSGEIIHFTVNGYNGISDIIYIELVNGRNEIVGQQRLNCDKLSANGEFILPHSAESGYYVIQAYTSWNMNFGTTAIVYKPIMVINPFNTKALTNIKDDFIRRPFYNITLNSEYQKFLKNINNRIIIKSLNKFLQPEPGTGIVFNSVYDTINVFSVDSGGLGSFNLAPSDDMKYFVQFLTSEKDTVLLSLPPAVDGLGINTISGGDYTELSFTRTSEFYYPDKLNLLIIKGPDIINFTENIDLNGKFRYESGKYGPGIYTTYILTDNLDIIAERNFFISPLIHGLDIRTDKEIYSCREKITAMINDPGRDTGQYRYEISVIKDNNLTYSTLNALDGFLNGSPELMVEWTNILRAAKNRNNKLADDFVTLSEPSLSVNDLVSIYKSEIREPPEYKGEILSGQVLNRNDNSPAGDQIVCLTADGSSVSFINTRTDSSGRFFFYLQDHNIKGQIILSCYPQDQDKIIHIDNHYRGYTRINTLPPLLAGTDIRKDLEEMMLAVQVQIIYGHYFPESSSNVAINDTDFYGKADFNLDMSKFVQLPVMEEVFFEIVQGVMLNKSKAGTALWIIDENLNRVIGLNPLIMIDGIPFFDTRYLLSLDPEEINKISVVHYKYYLGNVVFDGIINVRTKHENILYDKLPPGAVQTLFEPAIRNNQLFFPDYSAQSPDDARIPDYRTVLYWNGNISCDEDIIFYSSDIPGSYKIVVKEIRDGKVTGYGEKTIIIEQINEP
jgi:hypothetical protein